MYALQLADGPDILITLTALEGTISKKKKFIEKMEQEWSIAQQLQYGVDSTQEEFEVLHSKLSEMAKVWAIVSATFTLLDKSLMKRRCERMRRRSKRLSI